MLLVPWIGIPLGVTAAIIHGLSAYQGIFEISLGCDDKELKDMANDSSLAAFIASEHPILDALAGVIGLASGVSLTNSLSVFTNPSLAKIAAGDGEFWLGLDE
jgi:hypothetical protein